MSGHYFFALLSIGLWCLCVRPVWGTHQVGLEQLVMKDTPAKRIAIIGAGSGGASTAHYLQKYASEANLSIAITIYERGSHVGGRSTTVNMYNDPSLPIELGASIFVSVNKNLVSAAQEFGLDVDGKYVHGPSEDASIDGLGIWNGDKFVYRQSEAGPTWWEVAKLLWTYGLAPMRTQSLMKATVATFLKMYERPHFPFRSLSEVSYDLGLAPATTSTGEQFLKANGIGERFAKDVIQAATRVNYGQNLALLHGLEAMVCMAADGAMAVKGGNWQIFAGMIKAARADLRLNTSVTAIERRDDGTFTVRSKRSKATDSSNTQSSDSFDEVIIAAPFQFANIDITPPLPHPLHPIPYVSLHVTLFTSPHKLSPRFFNLPAGSSVPRMVITTLGPHDHPGQSRAGVGSPGFFSISTLRTVRRPHGPDPTSPHTSGATEYLYKIFSPSPPSASFLSSILDLPVTTTTPPPPPPPLADHDHQAEAIITWRYNKRWDAYPYLYPRITFERIKLAPGMWYTSGIESFISTMETSSLMGMNVARMVVDGWKEGDDGGEEDRASCEVGEGAADRGEEENDGWETGAAELKIKARL